MTDERTERGAGRGSRKAGYSLVEVSLALLVVGLGLVTIFSLFPDGLSASRKSVESTEVGAFADYVFASLDGLASSNNVVWGRFTNTALTRLTITHALDGVTGMGASPTEPSISPTGPTRPSKFYWIPSFYGGSEAPGVSKFQVATFTYTLDVSDAPNGLEARYARLAVWPGDVTEAVSNNPNFEGGTVFYREYLPLK